MEHRSNRMKRLTYHLHPGGVAKRHGWVVYRGHTLDALKVKPTARSKAITWEIHIYDRPGHAAEVVAYSGVTQDQAFEKAKRVVDAMMGD